MSHTSISILIGVIVTALLTSPLGVPVHRLSHFAEAVLHPQLQALLKPSLRHTAPEQVEVIVQKQPTQDAAAFESEIVRYGGRVTLDLHIINAVAAVIPVRSLRAVANLPGVRFISPDGEIKFSDIDATEENQQNYKVYLPLSLRNATKSSSTTTPTPTATPTRQNSGGPVVSFTPGAFTPTPTSAATQAASGTPSTPTPTAASGNPAATSTPTPTATRTGSTAASPTPTPTPTRNAVLNRTFYRGINLGGPSIVIDGRTWEGGDANGVTWGTEQYNQTMGVVKNADTNMEAMLRSGVRDAKGNTKVNIRNVPYGIYDVILYSWEYGSPQPFNIDIEGRLAQANARNSSTGEWQKLGPYRVLIMDGTLNVNSSGGYANFAGIEMWKVDLAEEPSPAANCYSLPRTNWSASSSNTSVVGSFDPANAIDADIRTRWSTDTQTEGMWFQIDLGAVRPFDTVEFDSGRYAARDYKFQVSTTGNDWPSQPIIVSGQGNGITTIASQPRNARYLRVTLTSSTAGFPWSIYDFGVFDCAALPVTDTDQSAFGNAIGLNKVRADMPYLQGQGIGVAILDSGVNDTSDLTTMMGTNRVLYSVRVNDDANQTPDDGYGHGNHIAGIIGGNGSASKGSYIGVAPAINIINVKVSNDDGSGRTSRIVAGMQWILQNRDRYNIRVANISLNGAGYESYQDNPLTAAAEILWFSRIVVVVSAGNKGAGNLFPPANDPFVITVGAVDDRGTPEMHDDVMPNFSAYGTTPEGIQKPDLVAPGVNIISLRTNQNSRLSRLYPSHNVDEAYFRMSGTSMAAPMVASAVALLLQNEPHLTPDQVKYRLMKTARPFGNPAQTGAGYLDLYAALTTPTNESANVGLRPSNLLSSGTEPVEPNTAWNSVSWNSVSWSSVNWNSVSWSSVSWGSTYWDP